jgi:hypothetical protein
MQDAGPPAQSSPLAWHQQARVGAAPISKRGGIPFREPPRWQPVQLSQPPRPEPEGLLLLLLQLLLQHLHVLGLPATQPQQPPPHGGQLLLMLTCRIPHRLKLLPWSTHKLPRPPPAKNMIPDYGRVVHQLSGMAIGRGASLAGRPLARLRSCHILDI